MRKDSVRNKGILSLAVLFLITTALILLSVFGVGKNRYFYIGNIKQGLDLKGGVAITYEAVKSNPTEDEMKSAVSMIRERLDRKNYTEAEAYQEGANRIRVEIPGVDDAETAVAEIGRTALLQFIDNDGNVLLDGTQIVEAKKAVLPSQTGGVGEVVVMLEFTETGKVMFADATEKNIGKQLHIALDGEIISSPSVSSKIEGVNPYISGGSGGFTSEYAEELAALIRAGSLPFNLIVSDMNQVGARLGTNSLETGIMAGIIGALLVLIFMFIMYGFMGLAADLALVGYISLLLNILSIFNVTLTLPGIAGIILSVGMAVDANVIIFERVREELESAKTLRSSIKAGFSRAFPAILDGNITTLIAAAVLFWLGTGTIKGFAQTLSIGIVLSMLTAIFITRFIINGFISVGLNNPKHYLINRKIIKKERKKLDIINARKRNFVISSAIILTGILFMVVNGVRGIGAFNLDVEFAGGTSIQIDIGRDFNNVEITDIIREITGQTSPQVQRIVATNEAIIKIKSIDQDTRIELINALLNNFNLTNDAVLKVSDVSAAISSEMQSAAVLAVVVACAAMLIYVSIRFKDIKTGGSAILALVHDAAAVVVLYAVLRIPLNYSFIAVVLTILGYSINATIIIFDRMRENKKLVKHIDDAELINISVGQTLRRSLYTSFTTLLTVLCLYIFGVDTIKDFALPIMFGIICGTYSSVYLAGSIWYMISKKFKKAAE